MDVHPLNSLFASSLPHLTSLSLSFLIPSPSFNLRIPLYFLPLSSPHFCPSFFHPSQPDFKSLSFAISSPASHPLTLSCLPHPISSIHSLHFAPTQHRSPCPRNPSRSNYLFFSSPVWQTYFAIEIVKLDII